jgi:hypothetical protein
MRFLIFIHTQNEMSDVGGLPDLSALVDSDGERSHVIIDTGANPDEVMKRRGYSISIVPGKKEEPSSSSLKRERSPPSAPPVAKEKPAVHNFKCTLEHAQHLLDLVDKRADASDKVEELAQKKEDAEDKRLDIERNMFEAARALAPAIVASEYAATCSDADKAVYQAVTNVYRTDPDWQVEDDEEEDSDEEDYRKSKITIVFWGNETTHNAGSSPQQPGKKTLYVHIIKDQFARACFSQGEVVYAWINTGLGTGIWEQPVLEKHAPILGEIARLHGRLIWFAHQVLRFMKMNERAWRGKSDKTRIFWRDHIIPKLQAVERAHDVGIGHVDDENDEDEEEEEEPPKRSKSGRKPKKKADPGPTEMSQSRQPPKKTTTRGGGRRKK